MKTITYSTQSLATDKHGNAYHGPRTLKEAWAIIFDADEQGYGDIRTKLADQLDRGGYTRVAKKLRKQAGIES